MINTFVSERFPPDVKRSTSGPAPALVPSLCSRPGPLKAGKRAWGNCWVINRASLSISRPDGFKAGRRLSLTYTCMHLVKLTF